VTFFLKNEHQAAGRIPKVIISGSCLLNVRISKNIKSGPWAKNSGVR
jgi:hypothetical protein